jgi:hypothetical protein
MTFLLAAAALVMGFAIWSFARVPEFPLPRAQRTTLPACLHLGGKRAYCECLDRQEAARGYRPGPPAPPLGLPVIRYAMRHPRDYPIIGYDTLACLRPPQGEGAVSA